MICDNNVDMVEYIIVISFVIISGNDTGIFLIAFFKYSYLFFEPSTQAKVIEFVDIYNNIIYRLTQIYEVGIYSYT